jgi:RNA-directed DNA polymerase
LEPIFEREFRDSSFGFRPGRSCRQALKRVWDHLKSGKTYVVDADLKRFFDTIPHEVILDGLKEKISDGRVLDLIHAYLRQGVMEFGVEIPEEAEGEGTPQGSPLSPLLANIALHGLDVLAEDSGYAIVRYADDFVILCESREQAESALERVKDWTQKNGLTLHPEKTRIVEYGNDESFEFLGFLFRKGKVFPRKKSVKNLRDKVRAKTPRNSGRSLNATISDLNRTLKGWYRYFRGCPIHAYESPDGFVRRRLRAMLDVRIGKRPCYHGDPAQRWPNAFFQAQGLFSMKQAALKASILSKANH